MFLGDGYFICMTASNVCKKLEENITDENANCLPEWKRKGRVRTQPIKKNQGFIKNSDDFFCVRVNLRRKNETMRKSL